MQLSTRFFVAENHSIFNAAKNSQKKMKIFYFVTAWKSMIAKKDEKFLEKKSGKSLVVQIFALPLYSLSARNTVNVDSTMILENIPYRQAVQRAN